MISYLQKFNNLDVSLKEKVSGPKVMADMKRLEEKYRVNLATVIMRLMVHDISILDLAKFFVFEYEMEARHAEALVEEMKNTVLKDVADHIGFTLDDEPEESSDEENSLGTWKNQSQKAAIKTSDFFFSTEDEEEVKNLAKKLETFKTEKKEKGEPVKTVENVEEMTQEILKRLNINFSSEELSERFAQVAKTYLKGVRNKIDTKATLMKDLDSGGMDLNEDLAQKVISIIDQVKEEFKDKKPVSAPKKIELPEDSEEEEKTATSSQKDNKKTDVLGKINSIGSRDTEYDFSQLKKQGEEKKSSVISSANAYDTEESEVEKEPEQAKESEKKSLEYEDAVKDDKIVLRGKDTEKNEEEKLKAPNVQTATKHISSKGMAETKSGKVRMDDVKYVPKLVGPIDELREMSLEDWRRLGGSPSDLAKKIEEKIKFLEKESYKKRLDGIKAWRQSPVNSAYLKIGHISMQQSKSLAQAIISIRESGEDTLNTEEFNAVMELNKRLRF